LIRFSVVGLFLLINLVGIFASPSPTCWVLALLSFLIFDIGVLYRMILGRPYIVSCMSTLLVLRLWALPNSNIEFGSKPKYYLKIISTIILFSLGTWIHGSWYIFLMIPFSFLLAGKIKDSVLLTACVITGSLIGAAMTGNFVDFLSYHFNATFNIYSEKTFNWLLVSENYSGVQNTYYIPFLFAIIALCIYQKKLTFKELTTDPAFILTLLTWLLSIQVIRFWIDWGRMALMFCLSYRFKDLIDSSETLKEPRVKYSLFLFVVCAVLFITTNDGGGRYSKDVFDQPINFNEERLVGWAPEPGGIVYSDSMGVFYKHFYEYPTAPWKYILGFESAIMPDEDRKVLRRIGYNFRRPQEFLPWINKMTKADRLITIGSVGDFPQLESIRGARNYWIYRLKTATETADINASGTVTINATATADLKAYETVNINASGTANMNATATANINSSETININSK
ncbi:MAG: hypothetical protein J6Z11_11015, partial [Candidatus Riflebacteria bacterium]|nr:hypothetical protein [Candidatus Riflebacteria bacterium]